jgi:ATP-dependent Clp protease protease subunit
MVQQKSDEKKGLKDYGIIYLSGSIEASAAQSVCEQIIEINVAGQIDHIQMIINSPGGLCTDGFAIIDMMEWSRIPIYTAGIGMIASMGLLIFMAGERGRRVITARTSILSHRFSGMARGNHSQLIAGRKEEDLMHRRIVEHYLQYTKVEGPEALEAYLLRDVDTWLSPEEAVRFGIADVVEARVQREGLMGH